MTRMRPVSRCRNRPSSCPAVAPAARLSMPTKSVPSMEFWSEMKGRARMPRCDSRVIASRTCGDSGAMIATPSTWRGIEAAEEIGDLMRVVLMDLLDRHRHHVGGEAGIGLGGARQEFLQEFIAAERQHEDEAIALAAGQVGGRDIAHEADVLDRPIDRLDRLAVHAGAAVEDAVDGGEADARRLGKILGRRPKHPHPPQCRLPLPFDFRSKIAGRQSK